ncbi:tetratricopeptide repeat protein [Leptothrix ochracea]|uniref:tetratricopeptide repeat protein n=1 Tax=Leptothrix ochracea TaxID=735331 RepID=UPI0034E2BD0C
MSLKQLIRSHRRPFVLFAILVSLTVGYVAYGIREANSNPPMVVFNPPIPPSAEPPLAGTNAISHFTVQRKNGSWTAEFDYFYTGSPPAAQWRITQFTEVGADPSQGRMAFMPMKVERGAHHISIDMQHPGESAIVIQQVTVEMVGAMNQLSASQTIRQPMEWPSWQVWFRDRNLASKSNDELLKQAVVLIDQSDQQSLSEAKVILERLITKDPQMDAGYVELARVAMKTRWGPEGFHQAENLLDSALQIRPDSVNAKILLGYVYAHQNRYAPAERLFSEAATSNPPNIWLWANWGELYVMQNRIDQAIPKYREAIARPRTGGTYDRARLDAYFKLLNLLKQRKDKDGMETIHQQRVAEYGAGSCYAAEYAQFLLTERGDATKATDMATQSLSADDCTDVDTRHVLGMAHYVVWSKATGPKRQSALNQARIYLPAGPMPLYLLAGSDVTLVAAQQLISAGEQIDQRDNDKLTALAYAMDRRDHDTARRLLKLGAKPEATVSENEIPVAFIPVLAGDVDGVRLLQQFGINYTTLRFQGMTAADIAKRMGKLPLLKVLEPRTSL